MPVQDVIRVIESRTHSDDEETVASQSKDRQLIDVHGFYSALASADEFDSFHVRTAKSVEFFNTHVTLRKIFDTYDQLQRTDFDKIVMRAVLRMARTVLAELTHGISFSYMEKHRTVYGEIAFRTLAGPCSQKIIPEEKLKRMLILTKEPWARSTRRAKSRLVKFRKPCCLDFSIRHQPEYELLQIEGDRELLYAVPGTTMKPLTASKAAVKLNEFRHNLEEKIQAEELELLRQHNIAKKRAEEKILQIAAENGAILNSIERFVNVAGPAHAAAKNFDAAKALVKETLAKIAIMTPKAPEENIAANTPTKEAAANIAAEANLSGKQPSKQAPIAATTPRRKKPNRSERKRIQKQRAKMAENKTEMPPEPPVATQPPPRPSSPQPPNDKPKKPVFQFDCKQYPRIIVRNATELIQLTNPGAFVKTSLAKVTKTTNLKNAKPNNNQQKVDAKDQSKQPVTSPPAPIQEQPKPKPSVHRRQKKGSMRLPQADKKGQGNQKTPKESGKGNTAPAVPKAPNPEDTKFVAKEDTSSCECEYCLNQRAAKVQATCRHITLDIRKAKKVKELCDMLLKGARHSGFEVIDGDIVREISPDKRIPADNRLTEEERAEIEAKLAEIEGTEDEDGFFDDDDVYSDLDEPTVERDSPRLSHNYRRARGPYATYVNYFFMMVMKCAYRDDYPGVEGSQDYFRRNKSHTYPPFCRFDSELVPAVDADVPKITYA